MVIAGFGIGGHEDLAINVVQTCLYDHTQMLATRSSIWRKIFL